MSFKKLFPLLVIAGAIASTTPSCKSGASDAEIETRVEAAIANPDVNVDVKEAQVTLSGAVRDAEAKSSAEAAAKEVEDVKEVVNALTVAPPPATMPVQIVDDAQLKKDVADVEKRFSGIKASVEDGVITVTGAVDRDAIPRIMQAMMALRPKSVENKLTVK